MLRISPISTTQKLINMVNVFDRDNCGENKAKKTSMSTKGSTGADYLFSDHVSHAVSNFVSNLPKTLAIN